MEHKAYGEDAAGSTNANTNHMASEYDASNANAARSHNAYMLIYEKAIKRPLKVVCKEEDIELIRQLPESLVPKLRDPHQISSALSCEGTAIPRELKPLLDDQKANEEMQASEAAEATTMINTTSNSLSDSDMAPRKAASDPFADKDEQALLTHFIRRIPHSYLVYPGLIERIRGGQGLLRDAKAEETYIEVPFHGVQKFVPNEYYRQVHADNQLFLAEKQVFCNPFFKTTAQLMRQMLTEILQQEDRGEMLPDEAQERYMQVYQILDKLIFEMLVISGQEQKHLKEVTALLFAVLDKCDQALFKLTHDRVLLGTDEPEPEVQPDGSVSNPKPRTLDDKPFFDMLVTHRNQDVRELAEEILSNVTIKLFDMLASPNLHQQEADRIQGIIEVITQNMVVLMPTEVQRYWHKLGAYFSFFHNMVKDANKRRVRHFVQVGLVQKLVELVGRYNPANEFSAPPFDKLVATVCILARCQPMVIYLFGIKDEF